MYFIFAIFILISICFVIIKWHKRKKIIEKVCLIPYKIKCKMLDEIIYPLGYKYDCCKDIFSTTIDAWQKDFGYTSFYDKQAAKFNMVFDCDPIYFDYDGKTWLLEIWKGQYGINTGAEIGIYHADKIICPEKLSTTHFDAASEDEMLNFSFKLSKNGKPIANLNEKHWWLTGFDMGNFSKPKDLSMEIYISFPNREMLTAFIAALKKSGHCICRENIFGLCIRLDFCGSHPPRTDCFWRLSAWRAQLVNKVLCKLFLWITKPFCSSVDRLLFLYFFLPRIFRRCILIHKGRKTKKCKKYNPCKPCNPCDLHKRH